MEEAWLHQALLECYLPLLEVWERLAAEGVPFRLTLSLSPTLLEMLDDPLLKERFRRYLESRLELAEREVWRTRDDPFHPAACLYRERFGRAWELYTERCRGDLVAPLAQLEAAGHLELLTCPATHGYLPLLAAAPSAVRAQIRVGAGTFARHLGHRPPGLWLPECAYHAGCDGELAAAGLGYFFVDAHGLVCARPRPRYATFAPVRCPSGVACLARDLESSLEVWSARSGYPADPEYREFYRDIGWDLPLEYVGPYVHESGQRMFTGFKYYRLTGPTDHKEPYRPWVARHRLREHAESFVANRRRQVEALYARMQRPPILVAAYDAELFGHWWFEGPQWLEQVLRLLAFGEPVASATPSDYLQRHPELQTAQPNPSSWGYRGFHELWLNEKTDWIYRHLLAAARNMEELAARFVAPSALERRALNQAGRELLLAQASDWPFMIRSGSHGEYAWNRVRGHLVSFFRLYQDLLEGQVDPSALAALEARHPLFPDLDYTLWRQGAPWPAGEVPLP